MAQNAKTTPARIESFSDIREILGAELIEVRNGSSTPSKASAVANVAGKYLSSIKLQLEMLKLSQERPGGQLRRFLNEPK